MEEEEEISSPFWLQSSSNRRRRGGSSFLLNSGVLLVVLLVLAFAFIFIIIPSFLSFTSQIFKAQSVKKSWDSLNLVLVLFAIVCGFLSRNSNNSHEITSSAAMATSTSSYEEQDRHYKFRERSESFQKQNPVTPRRFWYDDHDQYNSSDATRVSNNNNNNNGYGTLNRLRSFSSHPDLRQEEASWGVSNRDDHQWRFYDDTHLYNNSYRSSSSAYYHHLPQEQQQWRPPGQKLEAEAEKEGAKEENIKEKESEDNAVDEAKNVDVGVDASTHVVESQKDIIYITPPRRSPSPTPPLPPQANKLVRRKVVKRTHLEFEKRERKYEHYQSSSSQPPPPPPPVVEDGGGKNEKKRGGAASATKEFLTSLRRNKKKKKQRQKSVENLDIFFNYESSYPLPPSTIPPPPPPPPPFFHNLFSSKKPKAKKIHSVIPTPPPPPPPITQKLSAISASQAKVQSKNQSFATPKPLPVKIKSYGNNAEETVSSGNESPLNAIPPPPPLPPFKLPAWKYEVHGDFVRLKSNTGDDTEESSSPSEAGGDSTMSPLFCPSPDVNAKADNFIARFRAGLRLEKMNSVKGRSNLGPEANPSEEGVSPN